MRILTALILSTAAVLSTAAPAAADPSGSAGPGTGAGTGARAEKVCGRLPQIEARADRVLARLRGDAGTPGSVAFTKQRADRARANGNTDLATALDSRAEARADLIPVLQKKKDGLPKATAWCKAQGYGA